MKLIKPKKRFDLRTEEDSNWLTRIRNKNGEKPSLKKVSQLYHKITGNKELPDFKELVDWWDNNKEKYNK